MEERGASRHRPRRFDRRELAVLWVATAAAVSMFTLLAVLVWHSRGPVRLDNAGRRLALSHRVESFLGAHYLSGLKGKGVSDAVVWLGSPRSAAAVVSVGFSLVRLGLHFATDVVGGAAVVVAVVLGLTGVLSAMLDPRPRPAPEPAHNGTVGAQHDHR